ASGEQASATPAPQMPAGVAGTTSPEAHGLQPVGLAERSPLLAAWPRSAQITTAFLLGVIATLLVVHYFSSARGGARPTDLERRGEIAYRMELNHAPVAELEQLPGVGPKRAERIDEYRRTHGP